MNLKRVLQYFGILTVLLTLIPLIAKKYWWIVVFDFPHFQLTALTLISLLAFFLRFDVRSKVDVLFVVVLAGCFVFQLIKIYPFTPLAEYEILPASESAAQSQLTLYTANLYQKNKDSVSVFEQIEKYDTDVLVLTETNQRWTDLIMDRLKGRYEHRVSIPLENTYGMLLLSKNPLFDSHVKFIIEDSIPSIHAKMELPSKDTVQLFAIHPRPPMPDHNPKSTNRDAELMKIAELSRKSKYPVIVTGDFNDVAWSSTTNLFQRTSGLLDMRKGRGPFNTYSAKYPVFRWPLDHIFVSDAFRVVNLEVGNEIGSDHFPMYAELSFETTGSHEQTIPPPTEGELSRAERFIRRAELTD